MTEGYAGSFEVGKLHKPRLKIEKGEFGQLLIYSNKCRLISKSEYTIEFKWRFRVISMVVSNTDTEILNFRITDRLFGKIGNGIYEGEIFKCDYNQFKESIGADS